MQNAKMDIGNIRYMITKIHEVNFKRVQFSFKGYTYISFPIGFANPIVYLKNFYI